MVQLCEQAAFPVDFCCSHLQSEVAMLQERGKTGNGTEEQCVCVCVSMGRGLLDYEIEEEG